MRDFPKAPENPDLWRVHYAQGSRRTRSSSGQVSLFEDREDFEAWLMDALLEAEGRGRRSDRASRWSVVIWWDRNKDPDDDEGWGITDVLGVWQLVDGQWVPREFSLVPPGVEIKEPRPW